MNFKITSLEVKYIFFVILIIFFTAFLGLGFVAAQEAGPNDAPGSQPGSGDDSPEGSTAGNGSQTGPDSPSNSGLGGGGFGPSGALSGDNATGETGAGDRGGGGYSSFAFNGAGYYAAESTSMRLPVVLDTSTALGIGSIGQGARYVQSRVVEGSGAGVDTYAPLDCAITSSLGTNIVQGETVEFTVASKPTDEASKQSYEKNDRKLPNVTDLYLGVVEVCGPGLPNCQRLAGLGRDSEEAALGVIPDDVKSQREPIYFGSTFAGGSIKGLTNRVFEHYKERKEPVAELDTTDLTPGTYTVWAHDLFYSNNELETFLDNVNTSPGANIDPQRMIQPNTPGRGRSCAYTMTVLDPNDRLAQLLAGVGAGTQEPTEEDSSANITCSLDIQHSSDVTDAFQVSNTMTDIEYAFATPGPINVQWVSTGADEVSISGGSGGVVTNGEAKQGEINNYTQIYTNDADQTIMATFSDAAGNKAVCSATIRVDEVNPGIISDSINPSNGPEDNNNPPPPSYSEEIDASGQTILVQDVPVDVNNRTLITRSIDYQFDPALQCDNSSLPEDVILGAVTVDPVSAADYFVIGGCTYLTIDEATPLGEYTVTIPASRVINGETISDTKTFKYRLVDQAAAPDVSVDQVNADGEVLIVESCLNPPFTDLADGERVCFGFEAGNYTSTYLDEMQIETAACMSGYADRQVNATFVTNIHAIESVIDSGFYLPTDLPAGIQVHIYPYTCVSA